MKQNPCETDIYLGSQENPTLYETPRFVPCLQDPIVSLSLSNLKRINPVYALPFQYYAISSCHPLLLDLVARCPVSSCYFISFVM